MSAAMSSPQLPQAADFAAAIAPELKPLAMAPGRNEWLRRGLLDRVQRSALAHRAFTTVRREDAAWTQTSPQLRQCALSAAGGMRVDLLKLAPGASIAWPLQVQAQEILVVEGTLAVSAAGSPPIELAALNHRVLGRAAGWRQTAGSMGASLYVRSRSVDLDRLSDAEAQWWQAAQNASRAAAPPACHWFKHLQGVEVAVLQAHGGVASMLVRIAPGAVVPDHGHSLDEDCFMLDGDMFLGDILMRAGDYQLAPTGCQHVGIASDSGGLFYVHGAALPTASGLAR